MGGMTTTLTTTAKKVASVVLLALGFVAQAEASKVVVGWDANAEANVASYVVHYGTTRGTYANKTTATTTSATLDVPAGKTYYVAVQAVSAEGLASELSSELSVSVPAEPLTLDAPTASTVFPVAAGTTVTWTAQAKGGSGTYEYKFWQFSNGSWSVLQDYSARTTATWTPMAAGMALFQVWVRNAGSAATYEAWAQTPFVSVVTSELRVLDLTVPAAPVAVNSPVTLTTTLSGGVAPQVRYWVLHRETGAWTMIRDYGVAQATWTPTATGHYLVEVWVRNAASTAKFDTYRDAATWITATESAAPARLDSLTPNVAAPVSVGTPVTWTVSALGDHLEFQFWAGRLETGTWSLVKAYSPDPTAVWQPTAAGTYEIQVWARLQGSTATYELAKAARYTVSAAPAAQTVPLSLKGLTASVAFPAAAGTPITVAAQSSRATGVEYQFWLCHIDTGSWTVLRAYGTSNTASWTPAAGTYLIEVWARTAGSSAKWEVYMDSATLNVR